MAQQNQVDSLLALLKKDKEDTLKVVHLNTLAREINAINPDTSIFLSKQALAISQNQNWKKGIANSCIWLGWCEYVQGDYPAALDYDFKALKAGEEIDNKKIISSALGNIGIVYRNMKDFPKALNYYTRALNVAEEMGDKNGVSRCLGNLGIVFEEQGDYPKALNHYLKALKLAEEFGDNYKIATLLGNIGGLYHSQKDYKKALEYYFKALKMVEETSNKNQVAIWLGNIGEVYTKQEKYKEAEKYLLNALTLCKEGGDLNDERIFQELITNVYSKTGRHQLALEHFIRAAAIKDTLFTAEKNEEITRKEMNYEFEKKESAARAEQDKKDAVTRIIIYSVSAGFAFVLLLAVIIFRSYRQTQRANVIIIEQKKLVDEKQKDILDSIHYAQRIQRSLLPTDRQIGNAFRRLRKRDE